jgi:prefoldin subunit 5
MSLTSLSQILIKKVATLKDRALSTIFTEINKLKNSCPNKNGLIEIIKKRNQIVESLNSLKNTLKVINSVIDPLDLIISPLTIAIGTLKVIPIPVASPPVPGFTIGTILTAGDALDTIKSLLEKTNNQLDSLDSILDYLISTIDQILAQLELLDILINKCKNALGVTDPLSSVDTELLSQIQEIKNSKQNVVDLAYKGFTFEIIEEENLNLSITRRYAVAKNPQGIVLLKTPPSFTNDPKILIEELKFLIDSKGLIAN